MKNFDFDLDDERVSVVMSKDLENASVDVLEDFHNRLDKFVERVDFGEIQNDEYLILNLLKRARRTALADDVDCLLVISYSVCTDCFKVTIGDITNPMIYVIFKVNDFTQVIGELIEEDE